MAQIYQIVAVTAFLLSGVSLGLAVLFWFRFGVWRIIGELSGRTARRAMEDMRKGWENETEIFETVQRIFLIHTDERIQ